MNTTLGVHLNLIEFVCVVNEIFVMIVAVEIKLSNENNNIKSKLHIQLLSAVLAVLDAQFFRSLHAL